MITVYVSVLKSPFRELLLAFLCLLLVYGHYLLIVCVKLYLADTLSPSSIRGSWFICVIACSRRIQYSRLLSTVPCHALMHEEVCICVYLRLGRMVSTIRWHGIVHLNP